MKKLRKIIVTAISIFYLWPTWIVNAYAANPWTILNDGNAIQTGATPLAGLTYLFRVTGIWLCGLSIIISFLTMLFFPSGPKNDDAKHNILSKLGIAFLIGAFITILNIIKTFFDSIAGF